MHIKALFNATGYDSIACKGYLRAMAQPVKNQSEILQKLGIIKLNKMQEEAHAAILSHNEIMLLSPTGTGKTLAFLLPIIKQLKPELDEVQALILVPSRELALQIETVTREMGSGFKANAVYGGRAGSKDKNDLKHPPAILIGTPGRVADHIRRENLSTEFIQILVLDEFDKSLETGFEGEMKEIMAALPKLRKKILTSATQKAEVPPFVNFKKPQKLDFLQQKTNQLQLKVVSSATDTKLVMLYKLLAQTGNGRGIVFCSLKETLEEVSDYLNHKKMDHSCFFGGMEQLDRERALITFRNGTSRILLATDLAARGIDVPALDFIIHYELPFKKEEFTHRNGRTARMNSEGTAFMILSKNQSLPEFAEGAKREELENSGSPKNSHWTTLYITGGRRDKISKGDIAGLFLKQGQLAKDELGVIELQQDCAYVAVPKSQATTLINKLNNSRLKTKKVRISQIFI